ncbi:MULTISPECIES: glycine betaine ABC transporter substrate-binding protein [Prauserella salsuginis group]|uniref:Glycine betaine/proline transport system substrate-binding protein n=2 Tax=Prauserella salsuginis group TaxID=2893672 RepID=A0A839XT27_9PSEU|nr:MULTISPECIES: glycine betaine ABC transporter substrate-binding protein [Prauserella salsuginis group]MBB3666360.1 glycine betaine/proline transport system substrate-binding protein [Prauserella sediminis]MCR3722262.1 glycine betaine/proline transport system substrate-binding protein [Prauserella flava]MCR3736260.1 glycine betaine/proline transport system substrate-binding protein [Prauserella salsuginis]
MRRRTPRTLSAVLAALLVMVTGACGGGDDGGDDGGGGGEEGGGGDLTIGYIAWDENIALANLFKAQLDERGYSVNLRQLDVAPTWQAVAQGEIDLFQDAWLPTTHSDYWAQYRDQVEDLGVWYDQATLDIAVPEYVRDVNSIADLKEHADQFGGTITGIEPGAGETRLVETEMIPDYGLGSAMTLQKSSTTAMLSALDKAIQNQEPIVVTLWHPHWAYSRYDLKDLEDPKGSMGEAEKLHMIGREGFGEDFPELSRVIENFSLTDKQLGDLENAIQEAGAGQELQAAQQWGQQNQELMDKAFGQLQGQ